MLEKYFYTENLLKNSLRYSHFEKNIELIKFFRSDDLLYLGTFVKYSSTLLIISPSGFDFTSNSL